MGVNFCSLRPKYLSRKKLLHLNQYLTCHLGRSIITHQLQNCGCHISQNTILNALHAVRNNNDRHRIQRVSRIRRAIGIKYIIGITVVGDNHYIVAILNRSLTTQPEHSSTVSTAFSTALYRPVWPTISPLAKFKQIRSNF